MTSFRAVTEPILHFRTSSCAFDFKRLFSWLVREGDVQWGLWKKYAKLLSCHCHHKQHSLTFNHLTSFSCTMCLLRGILRQYFRSCLQVWGQDSTPDCITIPFRMPVWRYFILFLDFAPSGSQCLCGSIPTMTLLWWIQSPMKLNHRMQAQALQKMRGVLLFDSGWVVGLSSGSFIRVQATTWCGPVPNAKGGDELWRKVCYGYPLCA